MLRNQWFPANHTNDLSQKQQLSRIPLTIPPVIHKPFHTPLCTRIPFDYGTT